jgi:hypothetical protein
VHDMRRSAARNLFLTGVKEQLADEDYRPQDKVHVSRYRIVDEDELRQARSDSRLIYKVRFKQERLSRLESGLRKCSHGQ